MMIDMGDFDQKGWVDIDDFIRLMKELGLIPDEKVEDDEKKQEELKQEALAAEMKQLDQEQIE